MIHGGGRVRGRKGWRPLNTFQHEQALCVLFTSPSLSLWGGFCYFSFPFQMTFLTFWCIYAGCIASSPHQLSTPLSELNSEPVLGFTPVLLSLNLVTFSCHQSLSCTFPLISYCSLFSFTSEPETSLFRPNVRVVLLTVMGNHLWSSVCLSVTGDPAAQVDLFTPGGVG